LTEIVGQLHGTSLNVESPLFLRPSLQAPTAEKGHDVGGGIEDVDLDLEQEVVSSQAGDSGAEDFIAAEEIAIDRESDRVIEEVPSVPDSSDEVELSLQMEGSGEETAAEIKPGKKSAGSDKVQPLAAESSTQALGAKEEQADKTGLNFEGLDLSDLSPVEGQEKEGGESGANEEGPLDLWTLDTSGADDLADLFDDLLPQDKTPKQAPAADEQPAAVEGEGGDPVESAIAAEDQPEKDDSKK